MKTLARAASKSYDIDALIKNSKHTFHDGWFFPSDLIPHSSRFKTWCKKQVELGLLESDEGGGRWGYRYRKVKKIPPLLIFMLF